MALEAGCLFSIDSDAHAPGQLDFQVYGCARAERLGVPAERIVNTWELDRLLRVGPSRRRLRTSAPCRPCRAVPTSCSGRQRPGSGVADLQHEDGGRGSLWRLGDLSPMLPVSSTDPSCCSLGGEGPPSDIGSRSPSSSGLGPRPFTAVARVRIPLGIRSKGLTQGPVAQLVSAPPCHGGGRRFEPGRGRSRCQTAALRGGRFAFPGAATPPPTPGGLPVPPAHDRPGNVCPAHTPITGPLPYPRGSCPPLQTAAPASFQIDLSGRTAHGDRRGQRHRRRVRRTPGGRRRPRDRGRPRRGRPHRAGRRHRHRAAALRPGRPRRPRRPARPRSTSWSTTPASSTSRRSRTSRRSGSTSSCG